MLHTTHRRRGRPAGMTPDRIRKRYIIVTGLITGLKVVEIALCRNVRNVGSHSLKAAPGIPPGSRYPHLIPFS